MMSVFIVNYSNFLNYLLCAFSVPGKFVGHEFIEPNLCHLEATLVEVHEKNVKVLMTFFRII